MPTEKLPLRFAVPILMVLLCAATAGCGRGGPKTHPVAGRVTYMGKPVTQGTIVFYPEEGRSAMGNIETDGSYRLSTFHAGDGALPGRHTVTITSIANSASGPASLEEEMAQGMEGHYEGAVEWLVPEKYSRRHNTPLTAEVPAAGRTIDFDLMQ